MPSRAPIHRGQRTAARRHVPAEQKRVGSTARGYGSRWQRAREGWLRKHPLCEGCRARGLVTPANEVDHVIPHRLGEAKASGCPDRIARASALFWDRNNWSSLCKPCHSSKTGRGL